MLNWPENFDIIFDTQKLQIIYEQYKQNEFIQFSEFPVAVWNVLKQNSNELL